MAIGTAAAILGSAAIGAFASSRAAGQQARGQERALQAQRELVGPFTEAGAAVLPQLTDFVSEGGRFSETQAFKDIINTQKARGQSLSGNTLTALTEFQQRNFRPQRFNELFGLARLGANAATGQATSEGSLLSGIGASKAAGTLGVAGSLNTGLQGLTFLDLLKNQGG